MVVGRVLCCEAVERPATHATLSRVYAAALCRPGSRDWLQRTPSLQRNRYFLPLFAENGNEQLRHPDSFYPAEKLKEEAEKLFNFLCCLHLLSSHRVPSLLEID